MLMKTPLDLSQACLYEQLAESAATLSRSASKMARILRGENYLPVSSEFAGRVVIEAYSELMSVIKALGISEDKDHQRVYMETWIGFLNLDQH